MFPDNTVLVNFAHLNFLNHFAALAKGRCKWGATVANECAESARWPGLGALVDAPQILGEPLTLDTIAEHLAADRIRTELSRPGQSKHRNLGEAETLAIITLRPALGGVLVTDDTGARRKAKDLSVRTYTTIDLLVLAVRVKLITAEEGWSGIVVLKGVPRYLPGCPPNYAMFVERCRSLPRSETAS